MVDTYHILFNLYLNFNLLLADIFLPFFFRDLSAVEGAGVLIGKH
jgi:hypothetical protein